MITPLGCVSKPKGNPAAYKHKPKYYDIVCAFDIETTYLSEYDESIMYIWQWAFSDALIVYGRTWEEYRAFLDKLGQLPFTFVVFVHNLSFEFQFLAGIFHFETEDVFCLKARKVAKAIWNNIEYRCSYIHSNMSLAKYIEHVNGKYPKLDMDYKEIRYPWTDLPPAVLEYSFRDVYGLANAVECEMSQDEDTLYTIPLTSTGYVRREAKRDLQTRRMYIKGLRPDYDLMLLLHTAFRGGDTHANRHYTGFICNVVKSVDRSSSYPDVMLNCRFPTSAFERYGYMTTAELENNLCRNALLFTAHFYKIRLKSDLEPAPYISISKCTEFCNYIQDNGRVYTADYITTTITDIDYLIIRDMYEWDSVVISDSYVATYGYLPEELRDLIRKYYKLKTGLKNVAGQEYFYMKSKNMFNSFYGMCAQYTAKDNIIFDDRNIDERGGFLRKSYGPEDWEKESNKYWLHYAWGVWVPAWARYRLHEGRALIQEQTGGLGWIYGDTDSHKYIGDVDFSAYNAIRQRESIRNGGVAEDPNGEKHYLGVYEIEGEADEFVTWGAKKYAYTDSKGLHLTVSGVHKQKGADELAAAGGLRVFKPGFIFRSGGGVELRYSDDIDKHAMIDGHDLHITRNVSIKDSTYKLSLTREYEDIIDYYSIDGIEYIGGLHDNG